MLSKLTQEYSTLQFNFNHQYRKGVYPIPSGFVQTSSNVYPTRVGFFTPYTKLKHVQNDVRALVIRPLYGSLFVLQTLLTGIYQFGLMAVDVVTFKQNRQETSPLSYLMTAILGAIITVKDTLASILSLVTRSLATVGSIGYGIAMDFANRDSEASQDNQSYASDSDYESVEEVQGNGKII